ncbi:hypothetical protein EOA91_18605, partial [Mesorhizobium sp. M1A.F.Ca.IN.022.04.1.1]
MSIALISISNKVMTLWQPDPALIRRPAYLSLADQFARAIHDGKLANGARELIGQREVGRAADERRIW